MLRPASKRAMDVALSAALLLLLLPVFLALAAAVAADGGPRLLLAPARRPGTDGPSAASSSGACAPTPTASVPDLLARDPAALAEWRAARKLRRDPRVTPVGRVLRATSLDELPQLINVLRGEMSLVGPRPVVQEELEQHYAPAGAAADYLSVRPGLTGPWQVSGRSDMDYRERVKLDADYARNPSLLRDLALLAYTVVVVLRRRGAY